MKVWGYLMLLPPRWAWLKKGRRHKSQQTKRLRLHTSTHFVLASLMPQFESGAGRSSLRRCDLSSEEAAEAASMFSSSIPPEAEKGRPDLERRNILIVSPVRNHNFRLISHMTTSWHWQIDKESANPPSECENRTFRCKNDIFIKLERAHGFDKVNRQTLARDFSANPRRPTLSSKCAQTRDSLTRAKFTWWMPKRPKKFPLKKEKRPPHSTLPKTI